MVEAIIRDYLNENLPEGVKAYMEHPEGEKPQRMVIIERTSSEEYDLVETAMLAVQSYGPSLYEAAALNDIVKNIMRGAAMLPGISRCKINTDYNYTDITTKEYRYQAVYDVVTHI